MIGRFQRGHIYRVTAIDHFSGDPTVVIRAVSNSIKAGFGLNLEAVAMAQHSSKI